MSLQTRLEALAAAIGADFKTDRTAMGTLASLTTTAKTSLVAAINEINAKSAGADPWTSQALTTLYTNSTVTAGDVFTGFAPVASTRYIVDILAMVSSAAATTGVQLALAGPTTGVNRAAVKIITAQTAATDMITHTALNTFQASAAGLTTPTLVSIQAILDFASMGAGNVKLQAKSEVAGSAITIWPGSSMRWRTI